MPYPTDLSDRQWLVIAPLVGRPDPRGAKPTYHRRDIINAILYINKTGCQWRMLPSHFPPVAECLQSFPAHAGTRNMAGGLLQNQRTGPPKKGRNATPSYLLIDSQSVKSSGEGEERGFHGGKKIKGRSRQVATDTQGNVWAVHVHAANEVRYS